MNDRELEARLRARYSARAGETEPAPLTLRRDVAAIPRSATPGRRSGRGRGMTLLAAAALLVGAGALAAGSGLLHLPSLPTPSAAVLADASPGTTARPSPSAAVSPSTIPLGLGLGWTNVPFDGQLSFVSAAGNLTEFRPGLAWLGDRFVLADVESGEVRSSIDGVDWEPLSGAPAQPYVDLLRGSSASWQDRAVGWFNPEDPPEDAPTVAGTPPITARDVVQIIGPSGAAGPTTPFKGRIESIGIGARGIVAEVHSHLDWDRWVTRKLGLRTNNDWTCCVKDVTFEDGVLEIKLRNRPGLKVVWADEGFEPGDYQDRGFGWYSPDGVQWTAMAPNDSPAPESGSSLPTGGWGSVAGVSDGFIATGTYPLEDCTDPEGSCTGIWYSADGLTWRFLATTTALPDSHRSLCIRDGCGPLPGQLLAWHGGALAIDGGGHATLWTSGGATELPLGAPLYETVATGPLGIVSFGEGQVFVSRDGIDHKIGVLPAPMAEAVNAGSSVVAVGDSTVLVLARTRTGEFTMAQSLWLGTLEP